MLRAGVWFEPQVYLRGVFYPICGHHFWDNHHGATTLCKNLGFASGFLKKTRAKYKQDSVRIGRCNEGQKLNRCTAGGNHFTSLNYDNGACRKGKAVGILVKCEGFRYGRQVGDTEKKFSESAQNFRAIRVFFSSYSFLACCGM